jgi:1-deoxy-D-xylulose-5-phosphate synthase
VVGQTIFETLHGVKRGLKDMVLPQGLFQDLGLKYIGPVDGHDIEAMEKALTTARNLNTPVIVHAITEKGRGYAPAIQDEAEKFHAVPVVDQTTGQPVAAKVESWTDVFSDEIVEIGKSNSKVVAITAAMLGPTGLEKFHDKFPNRTFDVGIAEQHAVTSAAGMAFAGLHPVVCIYSTFLNRAFDQLLMDVALHKAGVTFVLDRAGITGDDGASHNGQWDLALTGIIPGIRVAAPRDGATLKQLLNQCVAINDGPSVIRFPKGAIGKDVPAFEHRYGVDFLYRGESPDLLVISIGALASNAVEAASIANREGVGVTVVDPLWANPLPAALSNLIKRYSKVIVVEDGITHGGIASTLAEKHPETQIISLGVPLEFLRHAKRNTLLTEFGLDAQSLARKFIAVKSMQGSYELTQPDHLEDRNLQ